MDKTRAKGHIILALLLSIAILAILMPQAGDAAASGYTLKNVPVPTNVQVGKTFSVKGTLTSTNSLRRVEVGVVNASTGRYMDCAYKSVNTTTTSFNLNSVDSAMGFRKLPKGSYFLRIWAHDANGATRVLDQPFTVSTSKTVSKTISNQSVAGAAPAATTTASNFTLAGATQPGALKLKQTFSVKGTLNSANPLTRVEVGVVNAQTGRYMSCAYKSVNTTAKSFDLHSVDSAMGFSKLPKGTYYYRIWAHDKNGAKMVLNKDFTVDGGVAGKFTLTGVKQPGTLTQGQSFSVTGTLTSVYPLKKVEVGVVSASTGRWVTTAYRSETVNTTSYNLANVDNYIGFKSLPAGSYYFRIWAHDNRGLVQMMQNRSFTVTAASQPAAAPAPAATASDFTLTGVAQPSTLTQGQTFGVTGTLKSALNMTRVEIGVVSKATGTWVSGVYRSQTISGTSYNLAKLDDYIGFRKLTAGEYYYRIWVHDKNGAKMVQNTEFTVKKPANTTPQVTVSASGLTLWYPAGVISAIGKQPYSGPCSVYSMAYCRSIIDGTFSKGNYSTYLAKIIATYSRGNTSGYAYWSDGGGSSTYYSTQISCAQQVLVQLHKGKPCIFRCLSTRGINHYVCVIGYKKGTTWNNVNANCFIILDPATGTKREFKDTGYKAHTSPQLITFAK